MSLTSIIMVSYHTGPVLFEAIAGVLAQTAPVELCLVDNGNPPDIVTKLNGLAASDSRIRVITGHGNIGFSRACNVGARMANGSHFLFLNPDSKLLPDAVQKLQDHAAILKRLFMIGARVVDEQGQDQRGSRRALLSPTTAFIEALHLGFLFPKARLNFNHESVPQVLTPVPAISGSFMFLPCDDFWNIKGFDEDYFLHVEDLDLCFAFRKAGGEIYFAPDIIVTHVGGTSNVTSAFIEKNKARGFIRYFHKNFDDYPVLMLWALDAAVWVRAWLKILATKALFN